MFTRAIRVQLTRALLCMLLAFVPFLGLGFLIAGMGGESWWVTLMYAVAVTVPLWPYWVALGVTLYWLLFARKG